MTILSAVFGGVFALGQPLNGIVLTEDRFKGLLVGKQRINAEHIVMGIEKSPEKFVSSFTKKFISRAVFITDRSIMDSEKEHLTLLLYPPEDNKYPVTIIELGCLTGTCPKDLYIVHLISSQISDPEEDFKHVVQNLFETSFEKEQMNSSDKPQVLWSCYFSLPDSNISDLRDNVPQNVYLCPGPDMDLDYDHSIKKAKEIFQEIYPDTEFLPRAPDPEEIIIGGDDEDINEEVLRTKDNENEERVVDELVSNIEKQCLEEQKNEVE
ncbi:hypothetical protein NQ314_006074 [Rhamnusium bicolor]|uniref:RAE1/2 domain-containing protein n=1 Tax=Rhamnusium bicolor TaxID=1586634 RepID=A0AAV8Z981_9CUCU|nr:hypothetical protein NQ314_006074 [Rhamnusium bicolor]